MAYGTPTELAAYIDPDPAPANAQRLLERASRDVDQALLTSWYDVDVDGNATDAAVILALQEATFEQVVWRLSRGEDEGIPTGVQQASIGSVNLARGGVDSGNADSFAPQAYAILQQAQLTGFGPVL